MRSRIFYITRSVWEETLFFDSKVKAEKYRSEVIESMATFTMCSQWAKKFCVLPKSGEIRKVRVYIENVK